MFIGIVIVWNLQCASAFTIWPEAYAPQFELSGVTGITVIRGMGILILMWNVPYLVAFTHPIRFRLALYESLAMQTIGLAGESWIYTTLISSNHPLIRNSITRFIYFDMIGVVLLI